MSPGSASLSFSLPPLICVCLPARRPLPLNLEGQLSLPWFQASFHVWAWSSFLGVSGLPPPAALVTGALRLSCFLPKAALGLWPCHELAKLRFLLSAESACPAGFRDRDPLPQPCWPNMLRCWSPEWGCWPGFHLDEITSEVFLLLAALEAGHSLEGVAQGRALHRQVGEAGPSQGPRRVLLTGGVRAGVQAQRGRSTRITGRRPGSGSPSPPSLCTPRGQGPVSRCRLLH